MHACRTWLACSHFSLLRSIINVFFFCLFAPLVPTWSLAAIQREPLEGFFVSLNDDDLFHWRIWMEGPVDTPYHPGIYELSLTFPEDYPMNPPELHMVSDFFHPNVYPAGKVCISILHPPQHDELSGEHVSERWLPTRTPSSVGGGRACARGAREARAPV